MSNEADDDAVDETPEPPAEEESHPLRERISLRKTKREREADRLSERLTQQLAHQWAQLRTERRHQPAPIATGPSNFSRAQVPWGVDLAAAWAWRLLIIAAAGYAVLWLLTFLAVITLPVIVALFIAALVGPVVGWMARLGIPRGVGSLLVVIGGIALVAALLTFAGQQVAHGASDLADQVVKGIGEIKDWLRDGPLHATDSQINDYLDQAQKAIEERSKDGEFVKQLGEVGTALGHVLAGFFIILFSTYFFLADGDRIWSWCVRIAPRAARERVDSSGRVAWVSLTMFVRATVLVALTDAAGIMIVAAVLGVPFVLAIGVLVFLGAFVPMIGATIAGTVAVLVALVDQGPVTAVFMLIGVIVVQQIEGHILQPFLMGRFVSVHPLGVILAIGCGVLIAGIAGALVAVPIAAAVSAVVQHLASHTKVGDDAKEKLDEELGPDRPEIPEEAEMSDPVTLDDIEAARTLLEGVSIRTPMEDSRWLESLVGGPVLLKCENLQRTGSFKIRGAYVRMARLSEQERAKGVVAASAGNHAQGVALAAQMLGIKATVFMPEGAPIPKEKATRGYGADVIFHGKYLEHALIAAREFSDRTGAVLIHPFDHLDVVNGQATCGLEIIEQVPDVATVLVPTGGGGLLSGIAIAIKLVRPDVRVIGVQAEGAAAYPQSLAHGGPVQLETMQTMADGIAVGLPGDITFAAVRDHVDEIVTVTEESMSRALLSLLERAKMVVEPAGAVAVAAVLDRPEEFATPVVAVLSGGNVDPLLLGKVIRHGMAAAGRYLQVRVCIPDLPGGLVALLGEVAGAGANILEVVHERTSADLHLDEVEVLLQMETRGGPHAELVIGRLRECGYRVVEMS